LTIEGNFARDIDCNTWNLHEQSKILKQKMFFFFLFSISVFTLKQGKTYSTTMLSADSIVIDLLINEEVCVEVDWV